MLNLKFQESVFSEILRDLMKKNGTTQKALAEASKIFRFENKDKVKDRVDDRDYMYIPETFRGKS